MEGRIARWYTRQRASADQMAVVRRSAAELTEGLPSGADVLEVAPGPGFHAVEMARSGRFRVTGLDISHTFVEIATENARKEGVSVAFRHGEAADLPFEAESFDLIVCQAAFKNFGQPLKAIDEMHRVLRPGGTAVIQDMNGEVSGAQIHQAVKEMGISAPNALLTRVALTALRRRAYSPARFRKLVAESAFGTCVVTTEGIGVDVLLTKRATS
ncbi:class I SAM-dependent methyltransferase [Sphaerisporangium flaviroseum]|uniref:Class I SAM-dependent methyltransferase n=2 Tax=Sphaerisporangium flaviroseum TaxID=509199 RepID=A0ABP7HVE6_9ACTN